MMWECRCLACQQGREIIPRINNKTINIKASFHWGKRAPGLRVLTLSLHVSMCCVLVGELWLSALLSFPGTQADFEKLLSGTPGQKKKRAWQNPNWLFELDLTYITCHLLLAKSGRLAKPDMIRKRNSYSPLDRGRENFWTLLQLTTIHMQNNLWKHQKVWYGKDM